jgi:hypothetical protein
MMKFVKIQVGRIGNIDEDNVKLEHDSNTRLLNCYQKVSPWDKPPCIPIKSYQDFC